MIETAFLIAFVVLFIHAAFWDGMIFGKLAEKMHHWPSYLKKPMFDCPICMSFWHGLLILLIGRYTNTLPHYHWLQCIGMVFAAGGINTVLIYIINADKEVYKELKDEES